MGNSYSYVIIKENDKTLERESTLIENNYKVSKKYALITKMIHKDSSESIANIDYSNDLQKLQERANGFVSWYNYPLNLYKDMQQNIKKINN